MNLKRRCYLKLSLINFIVICLLSSCKQITKATDVITQPSARTVYERTLKDDTLSLQHWEAAKKLALEDSTLITLPYAEKIMDNSSAFSLNIPVQEGTILQAEIATDSLLQPVIIELFSKRKEKPLVENDPETYRIYYKIEKTDTLRLLIQTALEMKSKSRIKL